MNRRMPVAAPVIAVLALSTVTGCSSASGKPVGNPAGTPTSRGAATRCGTGRTAAGVPVVVEVETGPVACRVAMAIERDYARAVASGKVPGNGGGAPVTIRGWVCQGFNTPDVLRTGDASACHKKGLEILAVLPPPSSSPTSF